MNENITRSDNEEYEISLLDLLVILVKQRKFIIKTTALFAVAAIIYALAATPVYKSTLQIMPPDGGAKSGAAAMLAAAGIGDLMGASMSTTGDTIVGVVKSPAVLDNVIEKNHLRTRMPEGFSIIRWLTSSFSSDKTKKPAMLTMVRNRLSGNIQAAADKTSGIITISVKDVSPDMAVRLAQSIYDETSGVMQTVALTPTARKRVFLEEQIKTNNFDLARAEHKLITFQKKTGMIAGTGAPSDVGALASLQARMLSKEIELRASRRFATQDNPQVKRLQAEYEAIKKQFEADNAKVGTVPLSGVGLKKLPEASMEYATLYRDYKFREQLFQMLLRQYEAAKMSELDNPVLIQAIGAPTYPELKDSPKRTKIVILATLLGGFLGVFGAFIRHFMSLSGSDPEVAPKIEYVKNALGADLKKFRFGRKK